MNGNKNNGKNCTLSNKKLNSQTNSCIDTVDFLIRESLIHHRPADRVISYFFRQNKHLGSRDRRFILEICFSVLRWWNWITELLPENRKQILFNKNKEENDNNEIKEPLLTYNQYLNFITFAALIEKDKLISLELIYFWLGKLKIKTNKVESIINETDTIKKAVKIFALLQNNRTCTCKPNLIDLLPPWIKKEIPEKIDLKKLAGSVQKRPPMWLRCQFENIEKLENKLKAYGLNVIKHKRIKNAICVNNPKINLYTLKEFLNGAFEIQDIASQIIGIVCHASPCERWWDSCAGAGGKTLQLSFQMKNKGRVVATDIREYKLKDLKKRAARAGLSNISYGHWKGKDLPPKMNSKFDGVLVDAPCTCSGTWRRNPDAKLKITQSEVEEMGDLQLDILNKTAGSVKPGGVLVYATCSIFEKENTEVVKAFLKRNKNFKIDPFTNPLSGNMTDGTLNVFPWHCNCDATFVARFKRKDIKLQP
ncbi:MAG: RsmB/NOP family class I SAM-dependent RNA methyltransferase [Victivallales bacterium]|nr:RsmB/NOP family class I SAM-dependent RNA methyltransferase [Victivallales bacterium]MCF7889425.1 RsmB/NOP family class I SAM-dependent RNA methyltransferase [Victivallales bacterium]